jgi:histidinol dehydrogenase
MTSVTYIKRGTGEHPDKREDIYGTVAAMLAEVEAGGEAVARRLARDFDRFEGEIVVSDDAIEAASARVPWWLSALPTGSTSQSIITAYGLTAVERNWWSR